MFLLRRPSPTQIQRFLDQSRDLPLSRGPRLADAANNGGKLDEHVVTIGNGHADFEQACGALKTWRHFNVGWVQAFPAQSSIEPGAIVAVQIHHLGLWSLNGARVLETTPKVTDVFGFAYGTLTNHAESGEEWFDVSINRRTGDVSYRIRAVSRPQSPLAWIGFPMVRVLQSRFRRDSAEAMRRAQYSRNIR